MKHQSIITRVSTFILSIIIAAVSVLSYSVPVYAVKKTYTSWSEFFEDATTVIVYIASQIGAVVGYDFPSYVENLDAWQDYWNEDNVTIDEDANEVVFSADLIDFIKQAIVDYQNDTCGYQIFPTLHYYDVPVSYFYNSYSYRSMCELCSEYGLIGVAARGAAGHYDTVADMSLYLDGSTGFYVKETGASFVGLYAMDYLNWTSVRFSDVCISSASIPLDHVLYTWDDVDELGTGSQRSYVCVPASASVSYASIYAGSVSKYSLLVSDDGRDILVFNTAEALESYSVGHRTIYTTSGFYEDTGSVTVASDDVASWLDYLDSISSLLEAFTDFSGSLEGLTESVIEELLAEFPDRLFDCLSSSGSSDSGGSSGDTTNNITNSTTNNYYEADMTETNGILEKIYDKLSGVYDLLTGYFSGGDGGGDDDGSSGDDDGGGSDSDSGDDDSGGASGSWHDSVLDYLSSILSTLKSIKRWAVIDTVIDGADAIADWLDLLTDILGDADKGAEAAVATLSSALGDAAGLLKTKFPFSIPWDVLYMVTLLAADPEPPYFEIPFRIGVSLLGLSVDYTLVVDFTDFQWVSDTLRALLSMTYAVGLMKMTAGVAGIKKEE